MDIEREILCMSIPINKTYGLLPCPINILSGAKHIISGPLSNIINISVQEFEFENSITMVSGASLTTGFLCNLLAVLH